MNGRVRTGAGLALLVVVLLAVGWLTGDDGRPQPPFGPGSTDPRGVKALVDVLGEVGADVEVVEGATPEEATSALLLTDTLEEDARERLLAWVGDGGTLVVADPMSPLLPDRVGETALGFVDTSLPRGCTLPALADVERITAPGGALLSADQPDAVGCFGRGAGHWLVATPRGDGTVVALGGRETFTNRRLGEADNGPLAVALLAPAPDTARVAVLRPARPGEGEATLDELVPRRVVAALIQLLLAFLLVVAWRARRLGAPVHEPAEVRIASSELVAAVGRLLQQAGGRREAAALLRGDLRRQLSERFGLPHATRPDDLTEAVSRRRDVDEEALRRALDGPPPADDRALVRLAEEVELARAAALTAVRPASTPDHPDKEPRP